MATNVEAELPGGFAASTSPISQLQQRNQPRFRRDIARSAPACVSRRLIGLPDTPAFTLPTQKIPSVGQDTPFGHLARILVQPSLDARVQCRTRVPAYAL